MEWLVRHEELEGGFKCNRKSRGGAVRWKIIEVGMKLEWETRG